MNLHVVFRMIVNWTHHTLIHKVFHHPHCIMKCTLICRRWKALSAVRHSSSYWASRWHRQRPACSQGPTCPHPAKKSVELSSAVIWKSKWQHVAMIGRHLESLSYKAVKKLSLDVDIANEPTGEELSVHQHLDHFPWREAKYIYNIQHVYQTSKGLLDGMFPSVTRFSANPRFAPKNHDMFSGWRPLTLYGPDPVRARRALALKAIWHGKEIESEEFLRCWPKIGSLI